MRSRTRILLPGSTSVLSHVWDKARTVRGPTPDGTVLGRFNLVPAKTPLSTVFRLTCSAFRVRTAITLRVYDTHSSISICISRPRPVLRDRCAPTVDFEVRSARIA